jgi:putative transposase
LTAFANAFIESFNGRLRDECLNAHVFGSTTEAQRVLDAWREDYNHVRPHSALQDQMPAVGALWVNLERSDRKPNRRSLRDYFAVLDSRGGP